MPLAQGTPPAFVKTWTELEPTGGADDLGQVTAPGQQVLVTYGITFTAPPTSYTLELGTLDLSSSALPLEPGQVGQIVGPVPAQFVTSPTATLTAVVDPGTEVDLWIALAPAVIST